MGVAHSHNDLWRDSRYSLTGFGGLPQAGSGAVINTSEAPSGAPAYAWFPTPAAGGFGPRRYSNARRASWKAAVGMSA